VPGLWGEGGEVLVPWLGQGLAVVACEIGDDLQFPRRKTEQFGVADQVVGMLVMPGRS